MTSQARNHKGVFSIAPKTNAPAEIDVRVIRDDPAAPVSSPQVATSPRTWKWSARPAPDVVAIQRDPSQVALDLPSVVLRITVRRAFPGIFLV